MEIIINKRGGEKICLNGYMYTLSCIRKSKLWWKCVERSGGDCRASLSTDQSKDNREMGQPHNHPPDEAKIRVAKVKYFMRERAMNTEDTPVQIYSEGLRLFGKSVNKLLPSLEVCKRTIRRHRSSVSSSSPPASQQRLLDDDLGEVSNTKMTEGEKTKRNTTLMSFYGDIRRHLLPFEFINTDLEQGTTKTENVSCFEDSATQQTALGQPTAAKLLRKIGSQFEDDYFENGDQKAVIHSVQSCLTDPVEMQLEPHPQLVAPLPVTTQPVTKEKQIFIVADHQHCVMSSLASLWKNGKLCDAGIGNGSSTVMVHKLVLSAICPKLFSVFNTDIKSQEFLQVNFPREVSEGALNAFAEYMYNGILDLDPDILEQMKIIARRLDMTEFEQLCDSHLSNHIHQPASSSFTNVPLIQTMQIPAMTSSSSCSFGSTNFTQSTTPVIDNQQKISVAEVQKKPAAVFSQQPDVMASLGPHKSEDAAGFVINPSVKIEPIGPEDDQQSDHWRSRNQCRQDLTSSNISSITDAASSSITSVPASSSTEFVIPSSETTDVKSTRLKRKHSSYKAPHSSKAPHVSNSMNKNFSKSIGQPSNTVTSADLPTRNNTVYPVSLVAANGHNLHFTTETADVMTVNSFMPSEKT